MLRTIKTASVVLASTAALALGFTVPASADDTGTQAVVGAAYSLPVFLGNVGNLESGKTNCADIPSINNARSAENFAGSGSTITLYSDSACLNAVVVLTPGQSAAVINPAVVAYTST